VLLVILGRNCITILASELLQATDHLLSVAVVQPGYFVQFGDGVGEALFLLLLDLRTLATAEVSVSKRL